MRLLLWLASLFGLKRLLLDPKRGRGLRIALTVLLAVIAFLLLSLFFSLFGRLWEQSPLIALAYAAVVILVLGVAAWRLQRRDTTAPVRRNAYAQRRHAERAAAGIARRLQAAPPSVDRPVLLLGLPGVGRRSLQTALSALPDGGPVMVADDLGADAAANAIVARRCPPAALAILIVTQDLFSYQMPVIEELATRDDSSVLVFLNKCDLLDDAARTRIIESISTKCEAWPVPVCSGAAAPRAREVVVVDAQGRETRRTQAPPPQLTELLDILRGNARLSA